MKHNGRILFKEKQVLPRIWLFVFLLLIPLVLYIKFHHEGFDVAGLLISISVLVALSVLFIFSKLETIVRQDGIQYRLFPFQWSMRKISRDEIAEVFVRKYSPLLEYGGWGLRWGLNGKAINIRGNMGIQLVLKNGTRILIGTSNAEEAIRALDNFSAHPTI